MWTTRLVHVDSYNDEGHCDAGLALLGSVDEKFVEVTDVYEPNESGQRDRAFISKGYDATSHFETTVEDVLEMYTRITGKVLDLRSKDPAQA